VRHYAPTMQETVEDALFMRWRIHGGEMLKVHTQNQLTHGLRTELKHVRVDCRVVGAEQEGNRPWRLVRQVAFR
jgi:uncharacterized protein (UPF0548 family)